MKSTLVKEFESKEACPRCEEKKLYTNDTQKGVAVVHYHCLRCNHEFFEPAEFKELKKHRSKAGKSEEPSGLLASVFIAVMMIVIFAITQADRQNQPEGTFELDNQPSEQSDFLSR